MSNFTSMAKSSGAIRTSDAKTSSGSSGPRTDGKAKPAPHFDSILRAAPAYDEEFEANDEHADELESEPSPLSQAGLEPTVSIPDAIRPHLSHHHSLHAYLDANQMLEEMIAATQERVHDDAGKAKVRRIELKRAQERSDALQRQKGKAAALWLPKKKKLYGAQVLQARQDVERAQASVNELDRDLAEAQERLASLKTELDQFQRVEARLDALDNHVFGGLTHDHPEEDELEQKYHILVQTARRVQAAVQQEKRASMYLDKAAVQCDRMLKELLKGLQIGIDVGVASNVKHKHQLFVGSHPLTSARQSRGVMLRAKTICGDLHTHYISARAVQRRIEALPKLEVLELTRMPDMHAKNIVDEKGLHRSLETSYAQTKTVRAHIERERQKSKARQRLFRSSVETLEGQAKATWFELRAVRRNIIHAVAVPSSADASPSAPAFTATSSAPLADASLLATEQVNTAARPDNERSALSARSLLEQPLVFSPPLSVSEDQSRRTSLSSTSLPPPYKPELASQSSLGVAFPPLGRTESGTLADLASRSDWQAREQHRLLTLPRVFRRVIDRESVRQSRDIITRIAVEVGGFADDQDRATVGHLPTPDEEDIPGFHLMFQ